MAETKMQLVDWFDDLCVRFIINLPQEELESVERICFQVEEAQWFYEDFIRPLDATLPSLPLRTFCLQMFRHCPLLASFSEYHHLVAFDEFLAYKTRVPVRGAIMLNQAMDEVLLVRGWKKGANWSFPRGKINKDERDLDCAIREVYEETGYDIMAAGLVHDEQKAKYIEVTMREQHMKLYVFSGVPQDTVFQPRTRKEISKIEWYKLAQLPGYHKSKHNHGTDHDDTLKANKFYMVAPFLPQLKKWIALQRKEQKRHTRDSSQLAAFPTSDAADYYDTEENEMQRHLQHAQKAYDAYAGRVPVQPNQSANQNTLRGDAVPEVSGIDPAFELKRLLSVGQPQPKAAEVPSQQGSAADLLSMLRQSGTRPAPAEQQAAPPLMNYDSMRLNQNQRSIPQQYQIEAQRLPEMAAENRFQADLNFGTVLRGQPNQQQYPMQNTDFASTQPQQYSRPVLSPQPTTSLQQSMEKQNQGPGQQAPAPYQRTGDPHFARDTAMQSQQGPAIPSASDLPAPKLSNHALNLLNAFKGSSPAHPVANLEAPRRTPIAEMAASPRRDHQPLASQQNQNISPVSRPAGHYHSESRSRQALILPFSAPNAQENMGPPQPPLPVTNSTKTPQTSQQNTLLNLFRKPSQAPPTTIADESVSTKPALSDLLQGAESGPGPSEHVGSDLPGTSGQQTAATLAPDLVELSAMPSPGMNAQKKQLFDHKDGTMKEHLPQPRVLARPSNSHKVPRESSTSPLVSATMAGPPNAPDFGTARRKPRPGKSGPETSENVFREQEQPNQPPVQILRRPASPKEASSTTTAPAPKLELTSNKKPENRRPVTPSGPRGTRAPTTPAELKGSTPKPFQPQILRRPAQPPAPPSPQFQPAPASPKPKSEIRSSNGQVSSPPPTDNPLSAQVPTSSFATSSNQPNSRTPVNPSAAVFAAPANRPSSRTRPTDPTLDRRSSNTVEQKQTLLSLFSKPKTPASSGPASPAPAPTAQSQSPPLPAAAPPTEIQPPSASISRITSPLSAVQAHEEPPSAMAAAPPPATAAAVGGRTDKKPLPSPFGPLSPINTASPAEGADDLRRGSSGPISPDDRGFLLNYLGGFAKGPPKG